MEQITTPEAPIPGGHYSQAIVHNGLVYVAGQLPIEPATGEKILDSIENQTEQVLKNISAILEAAGSSLKQVIKTTGSQNSARRIATWIYFWSMTFSFS